MPLGDGPPVGVEEIRNLQLAVVAVDSHVVDAGGQGGTGGVYGGVTTGHLLPGASYMAQGSKIVDTTREVKYARVIKEGNVILFTVAADGFLYNMVRIMMGTLLLVAQGKIEPSDIEKITDSKCRKNAGSTVPACGLYLNKVEY